MRFFRNISALILTTTVIGSITIPAYAHDDETHPGGADPQVATLNTQQNEMLLDAQKQLAEAKAAKEAVQAADTALNLALENAAGAQTQAAAATAAYEQAQAQAQQAKMLAAQLQLQAASAGANSVSSKKLLEVFVKDSAARPVALNQFQQFFDALLTDSSTTTNLYNDTLASSASLSLSDVSASANDAADSSLKMSTDAKAAAKQAETLLNEAADAKEQADLKLEQAQLATTQAASVVADASNVLENLNVSLAEAPTSFETSRPGCAAVSDITLYPNGRLPAEVLCETTTAPGHKLRTDAAIAFDALSVAYEKEFKTPLCITDSYRSYEAQVRVHQIKPNMTATPGTSNHGWGIAIDACDGINSFDTPQHTWMRVNGPMFGWFLPSWAQKGGSRPEPWHFEFTPVNTTVSN